MTFFDLKIDEAKELARKHHDFCIEIENSSILVDFNCDLSRLHFADLFWHLYYCFDLHRVDLTQQQYDFLVAHTEKVFEELKRRYYLSFLLFSPDIPD